MGNEQGKNKKGSSQLAAGGKNQNSGQKCEPTKHAGSVMQICANGSCQTMVCNNCYQTVPGDDTSQYCQLCGISILNMQGGDSDDDDDAMAFSSSSGSIRGTGGSAASGSTGFQKIAVKRDHETGEIIGWQDFYAMARMDNPALVQEESKHTALFNQAKQQLAEHTTPSYVVLKEQPKYSDRIIIIQNTATQETFEVQAVQKEGLTVQLVNLPPEVDAFSYNYTNQEKWENQKEVIECLVTMHATLSGGMSETPDLSQADEAPLPTTHAFQQDLTTYAKFKKTDPSQHYDITSKYKLGSGGFAKVFKVMRKSDQKVIALKFIQNLKDEREKQLMYNEVALMNMCAENDFVLTLYDQYEYKGCLWIFVEIMDDALTPVIEKMHNVYSENCCKYILRQALLGLQYLHARHIIHRDIKSDNILVDKSGQVKLADFGYSAQLTTERDARSSKVGTVCWMAPELISGERRYGTGVDIWSYGIFAMELANGDPPYISEPQHRVIMNIVKKPPPPIDKRWSPVFQDFVSKCLIKDPKERWSADRLLQHDFLIGAADHKQEFGQLVTGFIMQRDQAKAKRRQKQQQNQ